ncbi:MAG: SDR family NAD(P)-dependent oxidoreductase [Actinomycetota bacterium]|nr:SDR family NAD(P)-dependent oxidoreductase [Actinomycetota bacterium]MDA2948387.1 SDR family NAD(P)-dependent oxidoreductase [Actinomycetota bacterium]
MADRSLDGASVVVVGASGGLGRQIARQLADCGALLTLAARDRKALESLGFDAPVVAADIRDAESGAAIVEAALSARGRIDGLVNAAGVVAFGSLADTGDEVIEDLFLTNVLGPLWLMRAAIPALTESRGFIANISAVVAEQPLAGMAAYAASKAALTAADRALTRELRAAGITVTDARPPHTETGLADRPIAGTAPRLREGLQPEVVAARIIAAIRAGEREIPAEAFGV